MLNKCSVRLLGEASTLDGKRYVNDAIGVVIERVGDKVRSCFERSADKADLLSQILPFLPTLARSIPALCMYRSHPASKTSAHWSTGYGSAGLEGEWLFKASLVVLTTKLVQVCHQLVPLP